MREKGGKLFDFQQMATLNIYVLIFLFGDTAEMFQ